MARRSKDLKLKSERPPTIKLLTDGVAQANQRVRQANKEVYRRCVVAARRMTLARPFKAGIREYHNLRRVSDD